MSLIALNMAILMEMQVIYHQLFLFFFQYIIGVILDICEGTLRIKSETLLSKNYFSG